MASEGGGKIKAKRSNGPPKPYARRKQSFLGRVTDTVKDMLSPSWLIDMVSTVNKKDGRPVTPGPQGQGEIQPADVPNINKAQDGQMPMQPEPVPASYPVFTSAYQPSTIYPPAMPGPVVSEMQVPAPESMPFPPGQLQFVGYKGFPPPHMMVNGADDQSEHSEYSNSTSGCSSMVPHPDKRDYQKDILDLNETKLQELRQDVHMQNIPPKMLPQDCRVPSVSSPKECEENSFLWSSNTSLNRSRPQPPAKSQKPAFNVSAFNTSIKLDKNVSLFGTEYQESPFYPGKTTFGGAASHRKTRLKSASPYQAAVPVRKQVQVKQLNTSSIGDVTSTTAQRILNTLEKMSTPLSDAKKIPANMSDIADTTLSFTSVGSYRRRAKPTDTPQMNNNPRRGPPVGHWNTPSIASVAKNRLTMTPISQAPPTHPQKNAQHNTPKLKNDDSKAQDSSTSESQTTSSQVNTMDTVASSRTGKMKRDKSSHFSRKKVVEEEEVVEIPDLPTGFTLPVASIPKINFGGLGSAGTSNVSATLQSKTTEGSSGFTFSTPIVKSTSTDAEDSGTSSSQAFKFSSPIKVDGRQETTVKAISPLASRVNFSMGSNPVAFKPKRKSMQNNEDEVEEVSFMPATELKTGSVMDILGKGSSTRPGEDSSSGFRVATELKTGSVMDILGKTTDKDASQTESEGSCGIQPASELKTGSVMDILGSGSSKTSGKVNLAKFQKSADQWECQTAKPGKTPPKSTVSVPPADPLLLAKFGKPSDSWECPTCMIVNQANVSKCPACETAQPKKVPVTAASTKLPAADPLLVAKFGKASDSWECPTCMIVNKLNVNKCVACETAQPRKAPLPAPASQVPAADPVLAAKFRKAAGSWECPTCMIVNSPAVNKCVACETANPASSAAPSAPTGKQSVTADKSLMDKFKPASGSWECDTCMVNNKAEATSCIACQTPKPGAKPTTGFTSQGGFKFGVEGTSTGSVSSGFTFGSQSHTKDAGSTSGGLKFGSSGATTDKETGAGGFKFGNAAVSQSTGASVFGNVKFGAASSDEKTAGVNKPAVGGFKFGQQSDAGISTNSDKTSSFTGVSFGQQNKTTDSRDEKPKVGGFKFGNTTSASKLSDANGQKSVSGGFTIGQTSEKNMGSFGNGEIKFGVQNAAESDSTDHKVSAANSGTNMATTGVSVTAVESQPVTVSAAGTTSTTGSFSFGTAAKTDISAERDVKPVFQFGAGQPSVESVSTDPKAGFQFGNTAGSVDNKPAFQFGSVQNNTSTQSTGADNKTVFQFGGTTGDKDKTDSKPASGLFQFGGASADPKPLGVGGFNFSAGKTEDKSKLGGFSFSASVNTNKVDMTMKRGRDEDIGPSDAKKPSFNFSASGSSSGPAFGSGSMPTAPSFNFSGGSSTSAATGSTNTFTFGQAPGGASTSVATGSTNTFTFGQAPSASNPPAFGFGTPAPAAVSAGGVVGTGQLATTGASWSGVCTSGPGGFGTAGLASGTPAFGSTLTPALTNTPAPAFGNNSAGFTAGSGNPGFGGTGGFQFGSAAPASGGVFQFGGNKQEGQSNSSTASTGFTFGGQNTTPQTQPAAQAFNFTAQTNFNFTGGQPAQPAGPFTFSAGVSQGEKNPFSTSGTASGNTAANRRIKRAVRKIKK